MSLVNIKEEQGDAIFAVHFTVKPFNLLYKMEHFSYGSGRDMRVVKLTKTYWLVVEFGLNTILYYVLLKSFITKVLEY